MKLNNAICGAINQTVRTISHANNKRKFTCYPRTSDDVPSAHEYDAFLEAFSGIVGFEYAGDWEAFKGDPKNVERADFFAAGYRAAHRLA